MTTARKNRIKKKSVVRSLVAPERGSALREALAAGTFVEAKAPRKLSTGQMIKRVRELQGLTQAQLADRAGMTQAAISALEHETQTLGIDRAKALAVALKVHPAVLAFPGWEVDEEKVG